MICKVLIGKFPNKKRFMGNIARTRLKLGSNNKFEGEGGASHINIVRVWERRKFHIRRETPFLGGVIIWNSVMK